jgi:hypothetical protein
MRAYFYSLLLVVAAVCFLAISTAYAQELEPCVADEQETELVAPGLTLTYDSSIACEGLADAGQYTVTVNVTNDSLSQESATLEAVTLMHTTPRPGGLAPAGDATASGLPLTIAPGSSASFEVSGVFELARPGMAPKTNLHLRVQGTGDTSGEYFLLGVNVKLRSAPEEEDEPNEGRGRPEWAPGPPPWAGPPAGGGPEGEGRRIPGIAAFFSRTIFSNGR